MQKLLNKKGAKTKRKWYQPHVAEPQELTGRHQQPNKHGVSEAQGHRARQLSHVLYTKICEIVNSGELDEEVRNKQVLITKICEIVNSGELDEEVRNKQVLITKIKMHPTFSGINVYWDANRADAAEIEPLLDALSGKLRSLLISYHVLGRIPTITFVKDKAKGDLVQLNQLFEVADYGPDYFPSTSENAAHVIFEENVSRQSSRFTQKTGNVFQQDIAGLSLDQHKTVQHSEPCPGNNVKLSALDSKTEQQSDCKLPLELPNDTGLPELLSNFRSNLYGLPRDDLMKKVLAKKQKVRYQTATTADQMGTSSALDSQLRDYGKLRSLTIKDKEKLSRQKDSTKTKQRLLEAEFDEVQDSLYNQDD
ncbi:ribosomal binding factor A [Elysia marginata]|uniref:Ribosomal binding factor A n=1 Tax=Elysia marginata TaxID=1093978 RepID=A0AAV4I9H0_9GAST|nr:ribosomal binding factor A [Elysia marginata]